MQVQIDCFSNPVFCILMKGNTRNKIDQCLFENYPSVIKIVVSFNDSNDYLVTKIFRMIMLSSLFKEVCVSTLI